MTERKKLGEMGYTMAPQDLQDPSFFGKFLGIDEIVILTDDQLRLIVRRTWSAAKDSDSCSTTEDLNNFMHCEGL
jgi:hypothetical protein